MRHNVVATRTLWCPILILLLLIGDGGWLSPAWAQTAPPVVTSSTGPQPTAQDPPPSIPVDLGRIKGALQTPVKVRVDNGKIVFFAEAVERRGPSFRELSVNFDLYNGPVPGAGMTHDEFLSMVTPKELYGSGGIKPLETLEWGLVNYAGWWAIRRLYKELREATDERRINEIRKQIDRELAALKGGK